MRVNLMNVKCWKLMLLISLCATVVGREILIPEQTEEGVLEIQLGKTSEVIEPDFDFKSVAYRQVLEADGESSFQHCSSQHAEVEFEIHDQIYFSNNRQKPLVIYSYEDLYDEQFIIDSFYDESTSKVYAMLKNNQIMVITLAQQGQTTIKGFRYLNITGLTEEDTLETGQFLKLKGEILFVGLYLVINVNGLEANAIPRSDTNDDQIKMYKNIYLAMNGFVAATVVKNQYLVIRNEKFGLSFYKFNEDKSALNLVKVFESTDLIKENEGFKIQDLVYYGLQSTLFCINPVVGVLKIQLDLSRPGDVLLKVAGYFVKQEGLGLLYIYGDILYVSGEEIQAYNLLKLPLAREQEIQQPLIKVSEIYQEGDILAFVGRNAFKLMYKGNIVNFYQDQQLDKVTFMNGTFVSVNENLVKVGNYQLVQPYTSCRAAISQALGTHQLVFRTAAQCSIDYLERIKVKIQALGQLKDQDTCIYSVRKNIQFWEKGRLHTQAIEISFITLGIGTFSILIVVLLKIRKVRRVQAELSEYATLKQTDNVPRLPGSQSQIKSEQELQASVSIQEENTANVIQEGEQQKSAQ